MNNEYTIREIKESELEILDTMLYEAIYQPEGKELLPRDVIKTPEIFEYIKHFLKRKDDLCLVAEVDGKIIGAVWTRILAGEVKGYGNIDENTPEFAISLLKEYRNKGIGTQLMIKMIDLLKIKGYTQASLSVDKENYAVKMYNKVGFRIIEEKEDDYLMLLDLNNSDVKWYEKNLMQ